MSRARIASWSLAAPMAACGSQPAPTVAETKKAAPEKRAPPKRTLVMAESPPADRAFRDVGFATPESVQHDATADAWIVSNINGSPGAADGNGFLSRIRPDQGQVEIKWIDGEAKDVDLDAPKGIAIAGDLIYVADLGHVRTFDRESGAPRPSIKIKGATFLNGMAVAPDGSVHVSDSGLKAGKDGSLGPSGTDAIYRLSDGQAEPIARGKDLGRPNGLAFVGEDLWVVSFGSGELYRIGAEGKKVDVQKPETGGLDGLVALSDGTVLISSWEGKTVLRGVPNAPLSVVVADVDAPADLGWDEKRSVVLIPLFNENAVTGKPLAKILPQ